MAKTGVMDFGLIGPLPLDPSGGLSSSVSQNPMCGLWNIESVKLLKLNYVLWFVAGMVSRTATTGACYCAQY